MRNYQIVKDNREVEILVITESDGTIRFAPLDESNSDYQRYLRWLENPDADESGTLS